MSGLKTQQNNMHRVLGKFVCQDAREAQVFVPYHLDYALNSRVTAKNIHERIGLSLQWQ